MSTYKHNLQWLAIAGAASGLALGLVACKSQDPQQAAIIQQSNTGPDPAMANVYSTGTAPATSSPAPVTRVAGQSSAYAPQQQSEAYPQQQAYSQQAAPAQDYSYNDSSPESYADPSYNDVDYAAQSEQAPPPLPEYDQPPAPGPDYYWTPGYWGWGDSGYYWVPGVWVAPPYYGALWTPPYWGYYHDRYLFHRGYWGHHVGFYGGINYGFGYIGIGYFGGFWRGNDFYYNRSVTNVGHVSNYYERPVVYNNVHYGAQPTIRVSYNGGRGGINRAPAAFEQQAMREQHVNAVPAQMQAHRFAAADPQQRFATNQGRPQQAAFARPEAVTEAATRNHINVAVPVTNARGAGGVQPGVANRPGEPNRAGQPLMQPNRGAEINRPGQPAMQPNRGVQPNAQPNRGAEMNRPSEMNRPGTPGAMAHPNTPANRGGFEGRPNTPVNQPAGNQPTGNRPETTRGGFNNNARPQPQEQRAAPQAQPQRAPMVQPQARPQPERMAPQPQQRPQNFQRPAPQAAPHVEAPRQAPQPHVEAPRQAPAPHPAAPPAPREPHGGGEHGHR